jgi:tRNA 2-thiouridine synthesizing protein A
MITLDLSGLDCPLPVLKTKKFLSTCEPLEKIEVITTDPASNLDLQVFCEKTGHKMLQQREEDGKIFTQIERKANN